AFVGGYYYELANKDRALEEAIAEADRLDPGWRLEEIEAKRQAIPPDINGALCVLKSKELVPQHWPGTSSDDRAETDALLTELLNLEPQILLTGKQTSELQAILRRADAALKEANRLKDLPQGRYPVQWQLNPWNQAMPAQETRIPANLL